ncbi:MAG: hypothetical protein MUF38_11395 [Anaerolineae bacterium]|nr:hypothetical protein [Anaerolineae bacterium]
MMEMDLKDYIKEEMLEECNKWYDALQNYFAQCNLYLLFMTRIEEFDYKLFNFTSHHTFIRATRDAYFETFIVKFYALIAATDRKVKKGEKVEKSLTLPNFYDFLKTNAKDKKLQDDFISHVQETEFLSWIKKVRDRLDIIRNKFLAHVDVAYPLFRDDFGVTPIATKEMRDLLDETEQYFQRMNFNMGRPFWFWDYADDRVRERKLLDIDRVLDFIAMNSIVVTLPEKQPHGWKIKRERLTDVQIAKINEIRRKMGLPDVE